MSPTKLQTMTRCALSAALLSVCAWITVPGSVPFTLQTFGVFLVLQLLGGRAGTMAIAAYLGLGIIGLPVFSGFRGGIGILLGTTGGYLSGFLVTALIFWFLTAKGWREIPALITGYAFCYLFGSGWFWLLYGGERSLWAVFATCVFPFVVPDLIKLMLSRWIVKRIRKVIISPPGP